MIDDPPDYIAMMPPGAARTWPGFPLLAMLVPEGRDTTTLLTEPGFCAVYLIEPGAANEALNGPSLDAYIAAEVPIRLYAQRAQDLRPFLRRAHAMRARGYRVEVVR